MAEERNDYYGVLGLNKECTETELRNAYKKLALKWHPDRCSASGNVEEAKKKFQAIQEAYSVLSDTNKRFLYDVGVYDSGDDNDENGMGDFLNEMAAMMSQNKSNEKQGESFEELQELFEEMFQSDIGSFDSSSRTGTPSMCSTSSSTSFSETCFTFSNKRSSSDMSSVKQDSCQFQGFCVGVCSFSFCWCIDWVMRSSFLTLSSVVFLFMCYLLLILEDRWNIWTMPRKRTESEEKHQDWTKVIGEIPKGKGFHQGMIADSKIVPVL